MYVRTKYRIPFEEHYIGKPKEGKQVMLSILVLKSILLQYSTYNYI